jgi:hypothetical protein
MGLGNYAQAQFVAFRLELPAGINFNSQVLDPMTGGTWEKNKAKIWIELEARENMTFLLDLKFPEREILPEVEAYYLNDGTADFEKASLLISGFQELVINNQPKLIRHRIPRPIHLRAWLGLPMLQGLIIIIEYP